MWLRLFVHTYVITTYINIKYFSAAVSLSLYFILIIGVHQRLGDQVFEVIVLSDPSQRESE
jgi:hypothetical protein